MYKGIALMVVTAVSLNANASSSMEVAHNNQARVQSVQDVVALFPTTPAEINERVDRALVQAQQTLANLLAVDHAEQTFANTALAYDRLVSVSNLALTASALSVLTYVSPDDEMRAVAQQNVLKIDAFFVEHIASNYELYRAFKHYIDNHADNENLDAEQRYFLQDLMKSFQTQGFHLPQEQRNQVVELKKELSKLEQEFEIGIAQDNRTIAVSATELKGLDADFVNNLSRTDNGLYVLGVDYPTYFNVMENCSVESTRKALWLVFENRAYPANEQVLVSVIAKRDELARLLGFSSYAQLNIFNAMAGTPERAHEFLQDLLVRAHQKARQEFAAITRELPEGVSLSAHGRMQPWNWLYVKSAYKKKSFNIDERAIAEYFPMEKTVEGLLDIYRTFFSLELQEVPVTGLWHSDTTMIKASRAGATLGYLILDLYPRANKFSHACECSVIKGIQYEDGSTPPVVAVVIANFPKSTAQKPSLLSLNDVRTFFHEFGHALHDVLGRTALGSLAGTNTKRDFVELPSQMLEEWLSDVAMLQKVSSHYVTGNPLSEELITSILKLKTFDSGDALQRQMFLSMLALEYYAQGALKDPHAIYAELYKRIRVHMEYEAQGHMYAAFGHLMGYGAQYYGYMWSKVFALDIFSEIKKHGLLNPVIGKKYSDIVIGKGGSQDPNDLLYNFLGRKPNSDAFFRDLGL